MSLGEKIRKARKEKKMSLRQLEHKLAAIFGKKALRYNTLYRIEKGLRDARSNSLSQICIGLGVSQKELQDDAGQRPAVPSALRTKRSDKLQQYVYSEKAAAEFLSDEQQPLRVLRLSLAPGGKTKPEQEPVAGTKHDKFVYVLKGRVTVFVADQKFIVGKDETLSFPASLAHYFENPTARKAACLVVQSVVRH